MTLTLYIGNKNYSSWSLRAWLSMKQMGLSFEEELLPLDLPGSKETYARKSPSGRVPCLAHGSVLVWDSLAIVEYLAETFPAQSLWPEDRIARAIARAVSAEMHAGFQALRAELPMNVRGAGRKVTPSALAKGDIGRIVSMWREMRERFGGPFLFGEFSYADAFYAPVASRFRTYGIPLEDGARAWADAVLALPAMGDWSSAARQESWVVEADEAG